MFVKKEGKQIGDWVVTTRNHECLRGIMLNGIEDEQGNRVLEIGWTI